ncbi:MAG TPA: ATP synthase F0 subunit C [Planctomycetota bacterium]|jgi:F-type H+-transporting ATPase subunit c|nr:ATP synthase F0 subunit C [Planctomycetota bacterium]
MLADMGFSAAHLSAGIGAGMAIIGVGVGMGRIAASANEGIARQPEAAGDIRGASLIFAAMLEGATLFAVVVALLLNFK